MSSLTKAEYITELKVRSSVLSEFTDSALDTFIDIGLRAYSLSLPELRVSPDNAVVSGQELYDYPAGALRIIKLRASSTGKQISFAIENQGNGEKIKPGNVVMSSYASLLSQEYYRNPLSTQQGSGAQETYTAFDVEFAMLHSMETIKDTGLEALTHYVEYLALNNKATEVTQEQESGEAQPVTITDRASDGTSTTVSFGNSAKRYLEMANTSLEKFNALTKRIPYGTRG